MDPRPGRPGAKALTNSQRGTRVPRTAQGAEPQTPGCSYPAPRTPTPALLANHVARRDDPGYCWTAVPPHARGDAPVPANPGPPLVGTPGGDRRRVVIHHRRSDTSQLKGVT
jgi:hypothetical protein